MPTEDEMRALGFSLGDYEADTFEVWEENWCSVQAFARLGTQWRHGMAGPTGLDYAAVLASLRVMQIPEDDVRQVFEDIQVMESAALAKINSAK